MSKKKDLKNKDSHHTFDLCLTGVLCALAIAGRMALWVAPNIQPVTAIVILIAVYVGLHYGIASAVVVPFVTNLLMGSLGMWTVYQMLSWGVIALLSWLFFRKKKSYTGLFLWSIVAAYIYGLIIDLCSWRVFATGTGIEGFLTYELSSLLYDTYHAIGNGIFISVFQPILAMFLKKHFPAQGE